MARFFHSLWSRWGFLFIVSSFGMSGPLRGWPCLAPTGLPGEDQWGFLLLYSAKTPCPALTGLPGASLSKLGTRPQGGESEGQTGDPPAGWGVRRTISNKEFRTAEVFKKIRQCFSLRYSAVSYSAALRFIFSKT